MPSYPSPSDPAQSKRRTAFSATIAILALAASGCSARYIRAAGPPDATQARPAAPISRNVIVVSVDGLRPDAIAKYRAGTLQRLMREGSSTLAASTILPSKTLPSHTSMLTGQPPERHQVLWNNVPTAGAEAIEMPNVFSVARAHGYVTAAFFSKAKFQPLQLPGTLDYSQAPGGWFGRWSSARTVGDVARYLKSTRPNLLFVHLTDPDAAGHRSGWMTREYGDAVLAADAAINQLIGAANQAYGRGRYSLIVTADHGGHGHNHGSSDPRDVTIPWIAWGEGVLPGTLPEATIRTMDTASTALWVLGVTGPSDWAGRAVVDAYRPAARTRAGEQ